MRNDTEIERFEVSRCTVRIMLDPDPQNPRLEFDHVGTMACWHGRYNLGDKPYQKDDPEKYLEGLATSEYWRECERLDVRLDAITSYFDYSDRRSGAENAVEARKQKLLAENLDANYVRLPLGLYDHSGISIYVGGRHPMDGAGWDSGRVGFIYCSLEKAQQEFGIEAEKAKGWDGLAAYRTSQDDKKPCTLREAVTLCLQSEVEEYDQYLTGMVYGYLVEAEDGEEDSCYGFFGEIEYVRGEARSSAEWQNERMEKADAEAALVERETELAATWP